jgi:hypothetical protein
MTTRQQRRKKIGKVQDWMGLWPVLFAATMLVRQVHINWFSYVALLCFARLVIAIIVPSKRIHFRLRHCRDEADEECRKP